VTQRVDADWPQRHQHEELAGYSRRCTTARPSWRRGSRQRVRRYTRQRADDRRRWCMSP